MGYSMRGSDIERDRWYHHWIMEGFAAFEQIVAQEERAGPFCAGASPGMAECFLIPQMWNARRFKAPLEEFPTLLAIETAAYQMQAFQDADPDAQPDAPQRE